MATTRAVLPAQPRGGVEAKNGQEERKNRTVLGNIGNIIRGVPGNRVTKPEVALNRPLTRRLCANLLANAHVNPEKKLKQAETLVDVELLDLPKEVLVNIDEGSEEDELAVVEYVDDIYTFYKFAEGESRLHDYMKTQPDINEKMRSILVDWLIEVHHKFELRQETLYLTINIIDRFLSRMVVPRKELQLVGIASMLIACKYEEIWAPAVSDFVHISDKAYVREQLLAMEKAILDKLEWCLTVPTPYMFLTRFLKASIPYDSQLEKMVYFFAELGIMNYSSTTNYPPSLLAASSVYAARLTLNSNISWTETLKHYTGYTEDELRECATLLVGFHLAAPQHRLKAVYKKYSRPEVGSVSLRPPAKALLGLIV